MDVHEPKLSSCWYFDRRNYGNFPPPNHQHDTVWPNYRPNCKKNAIGPQRRYTPSERKPCYRRFGVDRYTYWKSDIAVEKLRRIYKFCFYLLFCENAMGCQHKLNNQHIQFHSLLHTLAGLNENQCPRVQFQELLHIIWLVRLSQHREIYCNSTKPQQNDLLTDTQTAEESYQSLQ